MRTGTLVSLFADAVASGSRHANNTASGLGLGTAESFNWQAVCRCRTDPSLAGSCGPFSKPLADAAGAHPCFWSPLPNVAMIWATFASIAFSVATIW